MTLEERDYDWLNGWGRAGPTAVLIGTTVHCVGCGKFQGVATVGFEEGYKPPEKEPAWPFQEDDCPVCYLTDLLMKLEVEGREDKLTKRMLAYKKITPAGELKG